MRMRRRHREDPEINVGSFADVAFLLIIFFILTTELVKPAGEEIAIPSGTPDQSKQVEYPTVNLRPDGTGGLEIRYGERAEQLTMMSLRERLMQEDFPKKAEQDRVVVVDSSPEVSWQHYYEVTMAITRAGGVLALIDRGEDQQGGGSGGGAESSGGGQ